MKLPQSPSGFTGKMFGKLMELTNVDAYQKTLQALNPIDQLNNRLTSISMSGKDKGEICPVINLVSVS
jgi:hypothetical protein